MIFYFSGTGNSYWAARELGRALDIPIAPITSFPREGEVPTDDDVTGIVCPLYLRDAPWVVKEFLARLNACSYDPFIFALITYSSHIEGEGFRSIDRALHMHDAKLDAGFSLQMPSNFRANSSEETDQRLAAAPGHIRRIVEAINGRRRDFVSNGSLPGKGFVTGTKLYRADSLFKKFKILDSCDGCGRCVRVCPLDNVFVYSGKALHGNTCAACYACVHWCPKQATIVNALKLRAIKSYHHPDVTIEELCEQNPKKLSIPVQSVFG